MPRTRPEQDRQEKIDAIVDAAVRRLRDGGYGALSVAAIARELSLAQNAIYWYFPSRDELFVAAAEHLLRDALSDKPAGADTLARVLWFSDRLAELGTLRAALRDRAAAALAVAEFLARLDATLDGMLANALRPRVAATELPVAVKAFRATVAGTYEADLPAEERHAVLTYAWRKLTNTR